MPITKQTHPTPPSHPTDIGDSTPPLTFPHNGLPRHPTVEPHWGAIVEQTSGAGEAARRWREAHERIPNASGAGEAARLREAALRGVLPRESAALAAREPAMASAREPHLARECVALAMECAAPAASGVRGDGCAPRRVLVPTREAAARRWRWRPWLGSARRWLPRECAAECEAALRGDGTLSVRGRPPHVPREPQRPREAASLDGKSCHSPGARAPAGGTAQSLNQAPPFSATNSRWGWTL